VQQINQELKINVDRQRNELNQKLNMSVFDEEIGLLTKMMLELSNSKAGGRASPDFAFKLQKQIDDKKAKASQGASLSDEQHNAMIDMIANFPYIKDKVISLQKQVEGGGNLKLLKQSIKSLEDKKLNTIEFKDYKMANNLEELKEKIHAVVTKLSKAENAIKLLEEESQVSA
tara:strand:- start:381 stop:899 length:519 start_codon:yes stop_codon:yes gene_type:complete